MSNSKKKIEDCREVKKFDFSIQVGSHEKVGNMCSESMSSDQTMPSLEIESNQFRIRYSTSL